MATQSLTAARESSVRQIVRWLRDRIWATLDPPSTNSAGDTEEPNPEINPDAPDDVVRTVYERLCAEMETEAERRRAVENKLVAAGSVAPIAVTIMVAAASFLSSGRLPAFVPVSVIVIFFAAFYVALQFLRAMWASVCGLSRKSYDMPTISAILSTDTEGLGEYLRDASNDLARRIEQHRETTNEKVSQLAIAHESMRNAVTALVIELFVLFGLILLESLT